MLSLFPEILFLSPFAALLIRISLTVVLAIAAWKHLSESSPLLRTLSIFEIAVAVALFAGAWTQGVAILGFLAVGAGIVFPRIRAYPLSTTLLMCVMLLTLVVTGAGAFAFDLPL